MNVYYRVDLAKILIAIAEMQSSKPYAIVSDIDVKAMTKAHLFDKRTLKLLKNKGYVLNFSAMSHENNFSIVYGKNPNTLRNHIKIIKSVYAEINIFRDYKLNHILPESRLINAQSVFAKYHLLNKNPLFRFNVPIKYISTPESQFNSGGFFKDTDYQNETFRFIGNSTIPVVRNGRAYNKKNEEQEIKSLRDWKPEPLTD